MVLQDGKMHSYAIGSRELAEMGFTLQSEHEDEDGEARAEKLRNKYKGRIIMNTKFTCHFPIGL